MHVWKLRHSQQQQQHEQPRRKSARQRPNQEKKKGALENDKKATYRRTGLAAISTRNTQTIDNNKK